MPFITVLQSTENARAGGEFKGLILASTVSLGDYDQIVENQRKELSNIISGYKEVPNENPPNHVSKQNTAKEASNQEIAVQPQRARLILK